jgi:hypothetical protein
VGGKSGPAALRTNGKGAKNHARKAKPPRNSIPGQGVTAFVVDSQAEARARQLFTAMVAFRDGDFGVRLPTDWAGTDGRIAEAFNQALAHEDRITREVTRLSVTVGKEGRLRQRMSVPGAIGGWAAKVESLNALLDDLVRPTTEVARTIGAVAKGDLGQSMELEVDGRALKASSCARRSSSTR